MSGEGHGTFAPGQDVTPPEFGYPKARRISWKKKYIGLRADVETIAEQMAYNSDGGPARRPLYWYGRLMRALHDN